MSVKTDYICDNCGNLLEKTVDNELREGIINIGIIVRNPTHLKQVVDLDFCNVSCLIEKFTKIFTKQSKKL